MSSIAVEPPVTPSEAIDRSGMEHAFGPTLTVAPEIPVHAPPARVRTRRVDPWSRFRLAYVRSTASKRSAR